MHARHRNGPGNEYRSNAMGMGGVAAASRISPEGMRGHRVYNSEYRNNNRGGYGRGGHSKQFQPPHQPTRKTDIFVEAGKLAAEYLVSRGVLPPGALSGMWQNDGLNNQVGEFQGFRGSDELRGSVRERRMTRSFRNYQSEVNKELGKSGSSAERSKASIESDNDASDGNKGEQPINKDGLDEVQTSSPGEITQEGDKIHSGLQKCNSMEDAGVKASPSSNENDLTSDADGETVKGSDDTSKSCEEAGKEGKECGDFEQKQEEEVVKDKEDSYVSEDNVDLLKHCKFENVRTKARSSLKHKQDLANKDENKSDKKVSEVSAIIVMDVNENSNADVSSHQNQEESSEPDVSHAPALEKGVDVTYSMVPGQCSTSGSFPESSVYKEQEPDQVLSGFTSSNSNFMERDGKRAMDNDDREGFKKLREWIPQMDSQSDACLPFSTAMENHSPIQEQGASRDSHPTLSPDRKNLSISLFPRGLAESSQYMQEKQLLPVSFNTFDLNLNENHHADEGLNFPSQAGKEVTPSDTDLSMRNNCNLPNRNGKHGISGSDIEVIDLENDSAPEDKTFSNLERRGDAEFIDLDGFPNNVHNATEIPEVQDGYGLMISELLGNDNPNSESTGLNTLHNDIGLPNGEGILGDDDSIYMSLGEIPISFLRGWEQPTQDYGKPF